LWVFNAVVKTPLNRYHGVAMVGPDGQQVVHAYLGVPYAQPPRRFAPAQPLKKIDQSITDYDATSKAGFVCVKVIEQIKNRLLW
jgi:carboxylesterase type B